MEFKGQAKRLDDLDLPLIGRLIGVGEDEVHAILDVEAAGTGFDKQGRPKMLFEPHIFWKQLGPGARRDKAAAAGLAYPRWKPGAYPKDSYPRLLKAMQIDEEAALRSASWGLGQIMGFNCKLAGYPTAKAMVAAFIDDEADHLAGMIRFIKATGLDDELRRHDWKGFARAYNGAGFAKNGYDRKLAAAFARWQKIKDTPVPAGAAFEAAPVQRRTDQSPIKKPVAATDPAPAGSAKMLVGILALIGGAAFAFWNWLLGLFTEAATAVGNLFQ